MPAQASSVFTFSRLYRPTHIRCLWEYPLWDPVFKSCRIHISEATVLCERTAKKILAKLLFSGGWSPRGPRCKQRITQREGGREMLKPTGLQKAQQRAVNVVAVSFPRDHKMNHPEVATLDDQRTACGGQRQLLHWGYVVMENLQGIGNMQETNREKPDLISSERL